MIGCVQMHRSVYSAILKEKSQQYWIIKDSFESQANCLVTLFCRLHQIIKIKWLNFEVRIILQKLTFIVSIVFPVCTSLLRLWNRVAGLTIFLHFIICLFRFRSSLRFLTILPWRLGIWRVNRGVLGVGIRRLFRRFWSGFGKIGDPVPFLNLKLDGCTNRWKWGVKENLFVIQMVCYSSLEPTNPHAPNNNLVRYSDPHCIIRTRIFDKV